MQWKVQPECVSVIKAVKKNHLVACECNTLIYYNQMPQYHNLRKYCTQEVVTSDLPLLHIDSNKKIKVTLIPEWIPMCSCHTVTEMKLNCLCRSRDKLLWHAHLLPGYCCASLGCCMSWASSLEGQCAKCFHPCHPLSLYLLSWTSALHNGNNAKSRIYQI